MSTDTPCDGGGKYPPYPHCRCWPKRACCRCSTPGTLARFPRPHVDLPPRKIKDAPQS